MLRSSTGISKIPVNPEIDPGFGADTEQRRVEFAAKLEEEAFAISLGDATKIARKNLQTAIRLWNAPKKVSFANKLDLREIMIIWLIFELVFLCDCWKNTSKESQEKLISVETSFKLFVKEVFKRLEKNIISKLKNIQINVKAVKKIREKYGGDMLFSLKKQNDSQMIQIYAYTYNKLPKSLRERFFAIVTGVYISSNDLISSLSSNKKHLNILIKLVTDNLKRDSEYELGESKKNTMIKIVSVFSNNASKIFGKMMKSKETKTKEEVENRVKRYYGVK